MNLLTRFSPVLFFVFFLLYVGALWATTHQDQIELARQIIDEILVLQVETKAADISKKPAKKLNKHLKKNVDRLNKVIQIQQQGDDKKLRKEYKKLKHAMDKYIKLLSRKKDHGKKTKHGKVNPVVAAPLISKAEEIQLQINQLISDVIGSSDLDRDGDGIDNEYEIQVGTDPDDQTSVSSDLDGDGIPDDLDEDRDDDGVRNDQDFFPDDPDESADLDGDGIGDNNDQCPDTLTAESVNSLGCSQTQLDDDSDGVNNASDRCPSTLAGETVDALGCAASELDSDNDAVADNLDQCPNTLTGITVDSTGCPIIVADDSDRDTIADATDNCPTIFNPDQADANTDGTGDACEIVGGITIASPTAGQVINTSTTSVIGTFSGPAGSGVMVNHRQACVYNNQFVINNIPVNTGDHTIVAQLVPAVGIGESTQITINRDGDSLYTLIPNTNCAVAPFDAKFTLGILDASILQIDIDYDNDGITDASITDFNNPLLLHTYTNPGTYQVNITGFDSVGNPHNQNLSIIVQDGVAIDAVIQAGWQNITAGLSTNNIEQALNELTPNAQEKYGPVFNALQGNLPAILSTFSRLQIVDINADYAEYAINRTIDGVNRLFLIYFVKDDNGEWKLDAM